jgi:predicted transcriptional regulator of viral defense system
MTFMAFRRQMFPLGVWTLDQIRAWRPDFVSANLGAWLKKGYVLRLRQGVYTFAEYAQMPGAGMFFAGRLYAPSYLSLQYALATHGLIPESIVQYTSVTSLKTKSFRNAFGEFHYRSVKPELMFGFAPRLVSGKFYADFASPAKALCDLLYLDSFYETEEAMEELRLDRDVLSETLDGGELARVCARFGSAALARRVKCLRKVYAL